ncbi:LexA family protein [Azospirillum picis]|uniref:SOS-response transcriptional repressor LexA n=1 Tax=Azospirillum picis TaxID=488438 RepID=A0ABU0MUL4_9PROT|nr:MarR family transcriptional regulator [Azospirillum picis]MBP2303308.1 SOS-response transcriptional repressor LexA [Azospirillum picis]MDQ0537152.1 SOS-response transcriptional repressor LexA [Azospirillum picis]
MRAYGLTPRQRDCLYAIAEMTRATGVCPTYAEIGAELGLVKSNVHRLVHGLRERGWVEVLPNRKRSIALLREVKVEDDHFASYEWSLAPDLPAAG